MSEIKSPPSIEELSKVMELPLLAPELSDEQIASGCDIAKRHGLATVTVRPSDLELADRWTRAAIALGAAVDWPHGYSTTAVKQYAVRDALRRGAREITVTMNSGKLISRQFQYLEMELLQISDACHEVHALVTINLETEHLTEEHKIIACRVAKRVGADFLATTDPLDIPVLQQHGRDRIHLKLRGVSSVESALDAYAAGCARIESSDAAGILETFRQRTAPAIETNA